MAIKPDYNSEQGPSWYDVEHMMRDVENEHYCELSYIIRVYRDTDGSPRLTIACCATEPGNIKLNGIRSQRTTKWNRREFKTVTAVLYNLALGVDNYLTKRREEAETQTSF